MGLHLGFTLGSAQAVGDPGPTYSVSITGLTSNATYGQTAQIGVELTASAGSYSDGAPSSVAWQWYDGSGAISGATSAAYTPVAGDDMEGIYATATPSDTYDPKNSATYTVRRAPPTVSVAASISGDPVIGESLSGTSATFTGDDLTEGDEWEISDDGATGWTGTADTDTTGPAMVSGKHYRFTSTATNSGGSVTSSSSAIGPAVAPVISISGLTSGDAIIGDHASISGSSDIGTITAEKWGSASSGSEFGTGTNPTDFASADGGLLWYTPTIGGVEYPTSVDVMYAAPVAAGGLSDVSYDTGTGDKTVDASTDFTGSAIVYSVSTAISGVTINSSSGVVTIPTDSDATGTITVTGTNSGGSDSTAFSVTIDAASGTVPTTSTNTITRGSGSVTFTGTKEVFTYPDGSFGVLTTGGDVDISADAPAWQNDTYGNGMHGLMLLSDLQAQREGVGEQGFDETAGINFRGTGGVTKDTYAAIYNSALNKAPSFTASNLTIATSGGTGGCIKMIRRADRALDDGEIDNSELIEDLIVIHCVPTLPQVGEMPPPLMGTGLGLNTSDVDLSVIRSSFTVPTGGELSTLTSVADCLDYMAVRTLVNVWEGETRRSMCHVRDYAQAVLRTYIHPAAFHIMNPATDTDDRDQLIAYFLRHAEDAYAIQDSGGYQRGGAGQSGVDHFILAFVAALCPSKTALMTKSQARVSNLNELAVWVQAGDVGKGGRYESRTGLLASSSYHNNRPVMSEMVGEAQWVIQALDRNDSGDWDASNNTLPSARYCGQNHEIAINSYCMLGLIEKGWDAIFGAQATWNTSNDAYANFVFAERLYTSYDSRMLVIASENLAAWAKPIWDAERATMPEGGTPLAVHGSKPLDLSTEELDATVGSMSPVFADSGTGMTWDMTNVNNAGTQWTGSVTALTDQEFRFSHDTVQWGAPVSVGTGSSGSHTFTGKRYVQYRGTNAAGSAPWSSVWALFDGDFTDALLTNPKPWYINYMGGAAIPAGNPVNTEAPKIYVHTWDENAGWPEYTAVTGTMAVSKTKLVAGAGLWADGVSSISYQWRERVNAGSPSNITDETGMIFVRGEEHLSTASNEREISCEITVTDGASGTTTISTNWLVMPIAGAFVETFDTDPGTLPAVANLATYAWQSGAESMRIIPASGEGFSGAAFLMDGLTPSQEYDFEADIINKTISGEVDGLVSADLSFTGGDTATTGVTGSSGMITATVTPAGTSMYVMIRLRGSGNGTDYFEVGEIRMTPTVSVSVPAAMSAPGVTATAVGQITVDRAAAPDDGGATITSYDLRWQEDGGSWTTVTGITDPDTVTGLSDGVLHNAQTRAVNSEGAGAWSPSGSATTWDVPATMSAPTVTATGETTLDVDRASAPADNGSTITQYDLRWEVASSGSWTTVTDIAAADEEIASLTADTTYNVQTRAVNAVGAGAWSASGSDTTDAGSATVPAAMSAPTVNVTSTTALSVDRASAPDDGGSTITQYDLRYSVFGAASWTTVTGIAASAEAIGSLTEWSKYEVQTRAVNAIGAGDWSPSTVGVPRNTTGELYFHDFVSSPTIGTGGVDGEWWSAATGVHGRIDSHDSANARLDCIANETFGGPLSELIVLDTGETYSVTACLKNNMGGNDIGLQIMQDVSGSLTNKFVTSGVDDVDPADGIKALTRASVTGSSFSSGRMRVKARSAGALGPSGGFFEWYCLQVRQTS